MRGKSVFDNTIYGEKFIDKTGFLNDITESYLYVVFGLWGLVQV